MSKIEAMRKALSADARKALAAAKNDHTGTVVDACPRVLAELRIHGAIGERDGLTILGGGLAGRLQMEKLDLLFG